MKIRTSEKKKFINIIDRFKKLRVLVLGDFILDQFIWGKVERISPEAPVPVVHIERESYMPGGSLNVAHNIRGLNGNVLPCGTLGRDREGRLLVKVIRREGIDTGGMIYDNARPTTIKTRVIAGSQQVVRFDREKCDGISAANTKKLLKFVEKKIKSVDAVVLEDYGKGVIQPELVKQVVRLSKRYKKPVLVDPKERHFTYYAGVTAITPNRKEAIGAYQNGNPGEGPVSLEKVARALVKKINCSAVLMTLGEDGMMLCEKTGGVTKIPTAAREVFDVSGAGDTVIAVFAMAIAAGANMKEAAWLANLAAGIVVAKLGTACISARELKAAIEKSARVKGKKDT